MEKQEKKGKETDWLNYRKLKKGEIVKEGDEFLNDKHGWMPVVGSIGRTTPDPLYTSHTWYRRILS